MRVGERVASLRKLRGLTQRQLAEVTHFSTSLVKQVEQGTTPPSAAYVASAAHALGVTPAHLLRSVALSQPQSVAAIAARLAALD